MPARAREAELAWAAGEPRPLEGIPFAVKDLFDTAGVRTTYGSSMFDAHVPATDARAVELALAAGAILLGKTSTDEFAYGIAGVSPRHGPARNPWSPDRVSGGSSSGSAVALAALDVPLAIGSDTGGSIRVPSSYCGVVGLKGSWGGNRHVRHVGDGTLARPCGANGANAPRRSALPCCPRRGHPRQGDRT